MSLLELFVDVDNFCQDYNIHLRAKQLSAKKSGPDQRLSDSEIMTILIHFHQSSYRNFKHYYKNYVAQQLHSEFPRLVSYNRFVELTSSVLLPLCSYLQTSFGTCTGINFIDSTPLAVCHNKRIKRNKVFKHLAKQGCTSMGWFFGFKLHLIINDKGELLAVHLTPGNTDVNLLIS